MCYSNTASLISLHIPNRKAVKAMTVQAASNITKRMKLFGEENSFISSLNVGHLLRLLKMVPFNIIGFSNEDLGEQLN